jgi:hypothetical protein
MSIQTTMKIKLADARVRFIKKKIELYTPLRESEFKNMNWNSIEDYIEEYFYNFEIIDD